MLVEGEPAMWDNITTSIMLIFLGWLLGVLGPNITESIRNFYRIRELKDTFYIELDSLRYRLANVYFSLLLLLGRLSLEKVNWHLHIFTAYEGPDAPELPSGFSALRERLTEDNISEVNIFYRTQNEGVGKTLKRFSLPYIYSQLEFLTLLPSDYQVRILDILAHINMFNEQVDYATVTLDRSFNSSMTVDNYHINDTNLNNAYEKIAESARYISDKIGDLFQAHYK